MIKSKNKSVIKYFFGTKVNSCCIIQEVFTCFQCVYPAGFLFKGESHTFFEMAVVLSGSVKFTVDENIYNISSGQVIFFKPGCFHTMYNDSDSPVKMFIISFSAIDFPKVDTTYTLDEDEIEEIQTIYDLMNKHFDIEKLETVMKLPDVSDKSFNSVVTGIKDGELLGASLALKHLELFVLNTVLKEQVHNASPKKCENYYCGQILATMEKHISEKMTCAKLAGLCNISVSLMEKTMYKHLGCGSMKYFNILKMQKALVLLEQGISVKDVGEHLGFDSQSYFSTSFKRHFGYSPTQIKKGAYSIELKQ